MYFFFNVYFFFFFELLCTCEQNKQEENSRSMNAQEALLIALLEQCMSNSLELCKFAISEFKQNSKRRALVSFVEPKCLLQRDYQQGVSFMPLDQLTEASTETKQLIEKYNPNISCVLVVIFVTDTCEALTRSILLTPESYLAVMINSVATTLKHTTIQEH